MKLYAVDKLYNALEKGPITSKQIASRFKVANPRDLVYRLRRDNVAINTNMVETRSGHVGRYSFAD